MNILFFLPLVFVLFYIAGGGEEAFLGTTLLLLPFAKRLLRYGVSTPLFFLLSGVLMGIIHNNTSSLLIKDVFEISTLFLVYVASYEFTSALKRNPFNKIKKKVFIEFIIVPLPFLLYFLFLHVTFLKSLVLSLLFLSISPITSMILLYENPINREIREMIEGNIVVRDGVLILVFTFLSHFVLYENHTAFWGIVYSIFIGPFLGYFLVLGKRKEKKATYLFLPVSIVISILLEMYFDIPSVFLMVFAGFWERIFTSYSYGHKEAVEVGKVLYPFVYTYTGQLVIGFTLNVVIMGIILLLFKLGIEYIQTMFSKCRFKKVDVSVKIPMAGLSLKHLLLFKGSIPEYMFSLIAFVLIGSEFLAPLMMTTLKNPDEKV